MSADLLEQLCFERGRNMKLSREQVERLASEHLRHYERLLSRGTDGDHTVRLDECLDLIRIWQEIKQGNSLLERRFTEEGVSEIADAVHCGDYDSMLGIEGETFEVTG